MSKLDFYLTPLFKDQHTAIAEIEKSITNYCELIDKVSFQNDIVVIPSNFYTEDIITGKNISEYLYDIENSSDAKELLFETLKELKIIDQCYTDLYKTLNGGMMLEQIALLGMHDNKYIQEDKLYVNKSNDILIPHRYYLSKCKDIHDFIHEVAPCFPNLHFHDRVYETIKIFHDIDEHSNEIIRHLSVLNDHAKKVYEEVAAGSDEVYTRLEAEYDIICSGRGRNEGLDLFKCQFQNDEGISEDVRCNPHTKLYVAHSDYRIYFNWGRPTIKNGIILVGHVGGHWKKN